MVKWCRASKITASFFMGEYVCDNGGRVAVIVANMGTNTMLILTGHE